MIEKTKAQKKRFIFWLAKAAHQFPQWFGPVGYRTLGEELPVATVQNDYRLKDDPKHMLC